MYNPEMIYYSERDLSFVEQDDPNGTFDNVDFAISDEELFSEEEEEIFEDELFEEAFYIEEMLDNDDLFGNDEELDETQNDLSFLDDDISLTKLTNEINYATSRMHESEAIEYMEDRMDEFWPALAAALPAIIQLAPQAVNAISSIVKKDTKAGQQPGQTPSVAVPKTLSPAFAGSQPIMTDANSMQVLKVLIDLIQSPKFLELLNGILSGKAQTVTTNNGQQISGTNVLGVVSSLSGTLAGGTDKKNTESFFPEYTMSNEGTFLIDPHDALQEAELILDLIN